MKVNACSCLGLLVEKDPVLQRTLLESRGIDLAVATATAFESPLHRERTLFGLSRMFADCAPCQQRLFELGGVGISLAAMRSGIQSVESGGCNLISALAKDFLEAKVSSVSLGVIKELVRLSEEHPQSSSMTHWVIHGLNAVLDCAETQSEASTQGGVEVIVSSMVRFAADASLQERGAVVLGNISDHGLIRARVAQCGGIEAVILAMKTHISSAKAQQNGCTALECIAFNTPRNQRRIVELGGLDAILAGMKAHPENHDVQDWASGSLKNLLSTPEQHRLFMRPEISELVGEAVARFPESKFIAHCLESLMRIEAHGVRQAREEGVCSLVYCPRCEIPCKAERQYYCSVRFHFLRPNQFSHVHPTGMLRSSADVFVSILSRDQVQFALLHTVFQISPQRSRKHRTLL